LRILMPQNRGGLILSGRGHSIARNLL
jgi:hypothetical protein